MSLINDLQWRYATKKMTGKSVSAEQLNNILAATNLSATSYGLQPFTVIVVSNEATKQKLQAAAYGQEQVGTASHVFVFAVPLNLTENEVNTYIQNIAETRNLPIEALDGFKGMMMGSVEGLSDQEKQNWSAKQAYIALGTALVAAAEQKIDACPMEGFNASQFDEILNLSEKGLKSVVIMPIGFRAADDDTARYKKVRKAESELFIMVD
ncbi:MAG: NAD(P)H-dependent oxidoreductase [Chryseobacterium sp.]|nr:NAD(P)H-dependent oxidoreductase [Chryseobacterium sp.]